MSQSRPRIIPEASVSRLAAYLRVLADLGDGGRSYVSSGELAASVGVNPAGLRKDLSHLGPCGVRGVGYSVARLRELLTAALGTGAARPFVLVGAGRLGSALADHPGFAARGFQLVGALDVDAARIGARLGGCTVRPVDQLADVVAETGASIGVVTTPAEAAQPVCDRLVAAGVRSILTFAAGPLLAPADVEVRRVDLAAELQVLTVLGRQRRPLAEPVLAAAGGAR